MHCLYCDKPLALLKRLTGDGEFCSKEHRRIYQQEHNQLALARLLESQPRPSGKPRPSDPANRRASSDDNRRVDKETERPQPQPAAIVAPTPPTPPPSPNPVAAKPLASAPRFQMGPASGVDNAAGSSAGSSKDKAYHLPAARPEPRPERPPEPPPEPRPNPGPPAAAYVSESQPLAAERAARPLQPSTFRPVVLEHVLEGKQEAHPEAAGRERIASAGFVDDQPAEQLPAGEAHAPEGPRFGPLAPTTSARAPELSRNGSGVHFTTAKFQPAFALNGSTPGQISRAAADPHWMPVTPALAAHAPARICLVLGALLQGQTQPARQDDLPETVDIRFQPISFPKYAPRMGRLEQRPHRTDRIGFPAP
jgi:hypothetical protein